MYYAPPAPHSALSVQRVRFYRNLIKNTVEKRRRPSAAVIVSAISMTPLDLVNLPELMKLTSGRSEIVVGMVDGPIAVGHPDLAQSNVQELPGKTGTACAQTSSAACIHGTFVAGILSAKRGSAAPAICPDCTLLVNPVFSETATGSAEQPSATPESSPPLSSGASGPALGS